MDSFSVAHLNRNATDGRFPGIPYTECLILAFAIGTAVGMSALLSRYLGAKELDKVNLVVHNGIFLAFVTYAIFLVFSFFAETFIKSQTSDPQIIEYGTQYLTIVCRLSIMVTMQITMERILQGTGKTKYIFYMQVTGAIINVIMDPILIFGLLGAPRLGVAGAAIATVFGQTVGTIMGFYINHTKNHEISMNMKGFRPDCRMIKEIYRIGVPSIIMQAVGSAMTLGMNLILVSFSTTAVATFGAYFKIQSFGVHADFRNEQRSGAYHRIQLWCKKTRQNEGRNAHKRILFCGLYVRGNFDFLDCAGSADVHVQSV